MKTEKEYLIKIVNYKGKITHKIKFPENKKEATALVINLMRLYERAKEHHFLTKDLFNAIKSLALVIKKAGYHLYLFKYPVLLKHFSELLNAKPENLTEEIIYGKVREREHATCHVCRCSLVYPAYIVFKDSEGKEVKRSKSIGIKCLNSTYENLLELIEKIELNIDTLKHFEEKFAQEQSMPENAKSTEDPKTPNHTDTSPNFIITQKPKDLKQQILF